MPVAHPVGGDIPGVDVDEHARIKSTWSILSWKWDNAPWTGAMVEQTDQWKRTGKEHRDGDQERKHGDEEHWSGWVGIHLPMLGWCLIGLVLQCRSKGMRYRFWSPSTGAINSKVGNRIYRERAARSSRSSVNKWVLKSPCVRPGFQGKGYLNNPAHSVIQKTTILTLWWKHHSTPQAPVIYHSWTKK